MFIIIIIMLQTVNHPKGQISQMQLNTVSKLAKKERDMMREAIFADYPKLQFTNCAFRHSAPIVWNSLPQTVISDLTVSLHTFKSRLKTELYS